MTCNTDAAASQDRPPCPHLRPAAVAVFFVLFAAVALEAYMTGHVRARLNFFAEQMNSAKVLGNVLQTTAFCTPNVMPIYGSSELKNLVDYRAEEFFLSRPEGFRVFPIGRPGNTCLLILEKLAAAGPAVRGKKVGIFLSPTWFLREDIHDAEIQDNVTPIQLGAWMFGDSLSAEFKQRFARRLLEHEKFLDEDPTTAFPLRRLAAGSPFDRVRFALVKPVGLMRNVFLEAVDYWAELHDLLLLPVPVKHLVEQRWQRPPEPMSEQRWLHLEHKAETYDRVHAHGTPYSVSIPASEQVRNHVLGPSKEHAGADRNLVARVDQSQEWVDLRLLLDGLKELGADAIFISQPFNGAYRDLAGGSPLARRHYYDRLAQAVQPSGYPLLDYSAYEEDKYFFTDSNHPSAKAWIFYDHALDDFYHGRGQFGTGRSS